MAMIGGGDVHDGDNKGAVMFMTMIIETVTFMAMIRDGNIHDSDNKEMVIFMTMIIKRR
jgi:hypothetical protein